MLLNLIQTDLLGTSLIYCQAYVFAYVSYVAEGMKESAFFHALKRFERFERLQYVITYYVLCLSIKIF